ncbi:hypothetical protein B0T17DRAFT_540571 [Bombardia bombarda]|uniref:Carrier domain-containing protein n=1 Tax=Bombardia bombarda TaxID=252184 RepID=A0AA39WGE0_9PEZI|nr:hypothetical protein B0T17DRAFT_540571 [Bombardia bombarda]
MYPPPEPRQDIPAVFQRSAASASRLVHLIPDQLAKEVPDHLLFTYAKTAKPQDGFIDVTAKALANGVNRAAWYLRQLLGPPKNFESIGYMGANDIRYFLLLFGSIKVGYKMVFVSPRNTLEGHLSVLDGADCQTFLTSTGTNIDEILSHRKMRTEIIPELDEWLDLAPVDIYPYAKTFEEARMDPGFVLHSTGTTGVPKPIVWKVGILSTYEAWRTIPSVAHYHPTTEVYQTARRVYTSLPLFHTSGLNIGITFPLLLGVTLVYGAPRVVPNALYVDLMHEHGDIQGSLAAPSIYEELCQDPVKLERMKGFHFVVASGAPLSQKSGALISQHTRVISNLGSTETSCLQRLAPDIPDWDYFYWHPTHSGIEMREVMEGLYELFLVRDPKLPLYQGIFYTFPDITEWSMKDLYERHPTKHFLYRYKGRKDDVIVLSNGEKVSPSLIEATLISSPLVKRAMVVGRGRFQPAALLELFDTPPATTKERRQLVETLLPVIEEANQHAPAHGKLDQYHIMFADPARPIYDVGQGKIQRFRTQQMYETEIAELYNTVEAEDGQAVMSKVPALAGVVGETVKAWLQGLVAEITGIQGLDPEHDLFEAGIDSLQVIRIARELRIHAKAAGITTAATDLPPTAIYAHPTMNSLGSFLLKVLGFGSGGPATVAATNGHVVTSGHAETEPASEPTAVESMQAMLDKYVDTLPRATGAKTTTTPVRRTGMTVLLTGSTGSLGSYILDTLNKTKDVAQIVCLNRSADAAKRHAETGPTRGLSDLSPSRVEFLQADLSKPKLGLDDEVYARLVDSVTHVIHNQWPVKFTWSLASFEPYIRGVRNLIELSSASAHSAFILFVSSVSSVGSWKGAGSVPEDVMHGLDTAAPMGYGQSKLVSECLLDKASLISGVRSASCRVGVVAGPVEQPLGMWNKHEYFPSIFVSSAHLGVFPSTIPSRDRIDWLPVDKLAQVLLDILTTASLTHERQVGPGSQMFHVVNPHTTSWIGDVAPSVLAAYPKSRVRLVSYDEWVDALRESARIADETGNVDVERNPAIRLVEFYAGLAKGGDSPRSLASHRSEKASKALRKAGAVNQDWVKTWLSQWKLRVEE